MWDLLKYKVNISLVEDNGTKLTYGDLEQEASKLSKAIGGRCLTFILCKNSIGSVLSYISCIQNRIVPLMLNASIDDGLLSNLVNIYSPKFIFSPDDKVLPFEVDHNVNSFFGYNIYRTCFEKEYELYDDLALLLTTSGSTGSPKFVRQSYKNIESNAKSIVEYLNLGENERPVTSLPMNYTYGLSVINSHLMVGATICVTDKTFMQKEFWNFVKEQKVTSIAGVPYNYEILDKLRFTRMDLPYLKTMTQAGGKISLELHKKFAEYAKESGKKFVVMYGQCEATARMGYLPPERALDKIGSMGLVIPGGKFHLKDVDGSYINKPEKSGELIYEGENVTLGYAEKGEDLVKGDERNGILETGDIAKFDSDGYYYIVGRKKRFLKVFGNRVNLDELERLIRSHFDIEMAIGGVDDKVTLFVLSDDKNDEIKKFLEETTKLNHTAFNFRKVDSIPHNDSGKVLYSELNKLL